MNITYCTQRLRLDIEARFSEHQSRNAAMHKACQCLSAVLLVRLLTLGYEQAEIDKLHAQIAELQAKVRSAEEGGMTSLAAATASAEAEKEVGC